MWTASRKLNICVALHSPVFARLDLDLFTKLSIEYRVFVFFRRVENLTEGRLAT